MTTASVKLPSRMILIKFFGTLYWSHEDHEVSQLHEEKVNDRHRRCVAYKIQTLRQRVHTASAALLIK